MIQAVNSKIAEQGRIREKGKRSGAVQWRTNYIGTLDTKQLEDRPQARLVEMDANSTIEPHFHHVDQFQLFVAGSGTLGRNAVPLYALHYVDHHTAYGPINAGPFGLSNFVIRAKSDPGGVFLSSPNYKDFLKPTKKRYLMAENIAISTEPVLQGRSEIALEKVYDEVDDSDGLSAYMLRLGAGMETTGPDPGITGGQYYVVLNGSLQFEGESYPAWSTVYAGPTEQPLKVHAGPHGLEALVLNFPRSGA